MRRTPSTAVAASVAVALTLTLAAAASAQVASLADPDESPPPEDMTETVVIEDREEALLAYAQCMRDNGIDMDDPTSGDRGGRISGLGGGRRQIDRFGEEFRAAQEVCSPFIAAARPDLDPAAEQERLEQQLLLAQCIREAGYPTYPDPVIGSDGRLQRGGGQDMAELGIDRRSEEFRTLVASCREEVGLEEFGGGPGGLGRGPRGG